MAEYRRYVARDLEGARRRLEAESEELAARGLRPTWMVWVRRRRRWLARRGELIVQFDPLPGGDAAASARAALLAPLVWKARSLVRAQGDTQKRLLELGSPRAGTEPAGAAEAEHRRRELEACRRRLETLARELELELARLESLGGSEG